jgi:hypothetical protein
LKLSPKEKIRTSRFQETSQLQQPVAKKVAKIELRNKRIERSELNQALRPETMHVYCGRAALFKAEPIIAVPGVAARVSIARVLPHTILET